MTKRIDLGPNGHKPESDRSAVEAVFQAFFIGVFSVLLFSGAVWLIVAIWRSILSMM